MNSEYCNLVTGVPSIPINRGARDLGRKAKKVERLLTGQISIGNWINNIFNSGRQTVLTRPEMQNQKVLSIYDNIFNV